MVAISGVFVLAAFIIPFPLAIVFAIKLIKQGNKSIKSVLCCLMSPLSYFLYWLVSICLPRRLSPHQNQENSRTFNNEYPTYGEQTIASESYNEEILLVLLGPFPKRTGFNISNSVYNKLNQVETCLLFFLTCPWAINLLPVNLYAYSSTMTFSELEPC